MTKFLTSTAAQDRFIAQALDLMAARKADGAGLDFEPVGGLNPLGKYYVPFVQRFRDAMKARFPDATLVNALSAGGSERIIKGLVGVVDHEMVMTYNYRWSGSTITGAVAPLDHAARNVKIHIARVLQWAPAKSVLLGVPYYGYNWPVKTQGPERRGPHAEDDLRRRLSVTYASARDWLKAHPKTKRQYDALEGSAFYTYWSTKYKTYRQVYFDDERSLAAKYDYALVDRARRRRHLDARQRQGLRGPVERPAGQVLRPDPRRPVNGKVLSLSAKSRRDRLARSSACTRARSGRCRSGVLEVDAPRPDGQAHPRRASSRSRPSIRTASPPTRVRVRLGSVARAEGRDVHAPRAVRHERQDLAIAGRRSASGTDPRPAQSSRRDSAGNLETSGEGSGVSRAMQMHLRPIAFAALAACAAGRDGGDADPGPAPGGPRGRGGRLTHHTTSRRLGASGRFGGDRLRWSRRQPVGRAGERLGRPAGPRRLGATGSCHVSGQDAARLRRRTIRRLPDSRRLEHLSLTRARRPRTIRS